MKTPRFVTEFACSQMNTICANDLMKAEIKQVAIQTIDRALYALTKGPITINEAIDLINHPFPV